MFKPKYFFLPRTDDTCCDMHGWKYVGKLSRYFDIFITENDDADKAAIKRKKRINKMNEFIYYGTISHLLSIKF